MLRGASWNNNDRDNLLSSSRNNDQPCNRNDNIGFRCVFGASSPKARRTPESGLRGAGRVLPLRPEPRCTSLTCVPAPQGQVHGEKTLLTAVTRNERATAALTAPELCAQKAGRSVLQQVPSTNMASQPRCAPMQATNCCDSGGRNAGFVIICLECDCV